MLGEDPIAMAGAADPAATLLDFTDKYCQADECFSVVGGANVYRDQDHLTNTWALTLSRPFGEALKQAMAR